MKLKPNSPGWKLKKKLLEKKSRENQLPPWTERNIVLNEVPFSFKGHEYLKEPYSLHHDYMVFEKASQMGLSTFALDKSIHFCDQYGGKVIYWFPSQGDVNDFSQDRFRPICRESPYIGSLIGPESVDKTQMVQIGKGTLYFRGLFHQQRSRDGQSGARVKSIDADFLVFDELDEAMPKQKAAAMHRIDHSKWKWVLELSTPTIPDYGIDIEFQHSDQRFWMLHCPHCGEWNQTEEPYQQPEPRPLNLKRLDEETVILVCLKCDKQLDPAQGGWVAKFPSREKRRGYHICQLYSTFIDLNDVLNEWENPLTDRTIFFNHRLGLPYIDAQDRLAKEQVYACCRSGVEFQSSAPKCSGGCDVGDTLHVVITTPAVIQGGSQRVVFIGEIADFRELARLMDQYDIGTMVIDALPETHKVREFAKEFAGRVYICFYQDSLKGEYRWVDFHYDWETHKEEVARVEVNRTESIDATIRQFRKQEIILPPKDPRIEEFAAHMHAPVRRKKQNTAGEIRFEYVETGPDHYAHARNYCRIAETKIPAQPDIRML